MMAILLLFSSLERTSIISTPVPQEILADETAHFTCVGAGSFISISWQYDEICNSGMCGDAVVITEEISGGERQQQINSTLAIDTFALQLPITGREFIIRCVVDQAVPDLQGSSFSFVTRLTVTGKIFE
jgi:hypothetical protein